MKKVNEVLAKYVGAYKLNDKYTLVVNKEGRVKLYMPDHFTICYYDIAYWKYKILDDSSRFRRYVQNMTSLEFLSDFSDDCLKILIKYGYSDSLYNAIFSIEAMDDCYKFYYYNEIGFASNNVQSECKEHKVQLDILNHVFYKNRHQEIPDCFMKEVEKFLSKLEKITIQESMLE